MKSMIKTLFACGLLTAMPALAQQTNGCPEGSYSVVMSPDGATLSLLFDRFNIGSADISGSGRHTKVCRIAAPLNLPANHSIGVYKVDYRGFAKLVAKQQTSLDVQYFLGPRDTTHGRVFKRKVKGPHEGDFAFSETIGAGQMKRVGCGSAASLNVAITLGLDGDPRAGQAMASLDSTDAAPAGALVYYLDLKRCP